jgi:hypothetical protein
VKKACLVWVGIYALVAAALAAWFYLRFPEAPPTVTPRLLPPRLRAAVALGAGLGCAVPALLGLAGLDGLRTRLRERAQLNAALFGRQPIDGAVQPFPGRLVAADATLRSPLSERECVLYHYVASHTSSGKGAAKVVDAEGYGMAPSLIETLAGPVDVRAYLEPEFAPDRLEAEPSRIRLAEHQRTATLRRPGLDIMRTYRELQSYLLDDDGAISHDYGKEGGVERATAFEEHVVSNGDEVVVVGLYSAARRAVVPDPGDEILHRARLRKGPPAKVAGEFARQAIVSGVLGVLFLAGTVLLIRLFFTQAGTFN